MEVFFAQLQCGMYNKFILHAHSAIWVVSMSLLSFQVYTGFATIFERPLLCYQSQAMPTPSLLVGMVFSCSVTVVVVLKANNL